MHCRTLLPPCVFLCSIAVASPLQARQVATGNPNIINLISQCAPSPFLIRQFTTFSGTDNSQPQISFFFTNENGADADGAITGPGAPFYCSVTLPMDSDIMSDNKVWSCQNGTGLKFDTNSVLTVSQSMVCDALWEGAPIWTLASGIISTTAQPGVDGGVYNTSTVPDSYLEVINIVESIPTGVPNLPTCGQMCVSVEMNLAPSFGCSPRNYTCLCGSVPFSTAFRNCLLGCDSSAETQESQDYWNTFCVGEGVKAAVPDLTMPSGSDCEFGSGCQ